MLILSQKVQFSIVLGQLDFCCLEVLQRCLNIVFDNRMSRKPQRQITTRQAIQNIMSYSEQHGNLLQKYNTAFFLSYFDSFSIEELHDKLGKDAKLNKHAFVRQLTDFILHRPQETLFLVMGLLEVFARIDREIKSEGEIQIKDFTCFLCNNISSSPFEDEVNIKEIPQEQLHPNPRRVRQIDVNSARVEVHPQREVPKIAKDIKRKKRKVHSCRPLHTFYYNQQRKEIITLGRLASHIAIFNLSLRRTGEIHPACFKLYDKSMAIMSMAFSERQQRIGCIIDSLGMAFWDYSDQFQTEKLIRRVIGDRIYYLPLLDEWITADANTLHFWDLKEERVKAQCGQPTAVAVNDVKQITHLRCLAVSFTLVDKFKWLYVYKNDGFKLASRLKLAHIGAQKIHYNRSTQTLLLLGMNQLPVYAIDKMSFDLSLLNTLTGHDTIVTAISDLSQGLVVTGDDRGTMKVWDLQSLRCQQVIKVANTINKIQCMGSTLLYSDSRINVLKVEQLTQQSPACEMFGLRKFYRCEHPDYQLLIFTTSSCRIYDLQTGRVKRVVEVCINEQEIITVERLQGEFIISTSKGYLLIYSHNMHLKRRISTGKHEQEVQHLRGDPLNRLVTAVSKEGSIQVWSEKNLDEGPRKAMLNDSKIEVTCFDLSQKYSLMVTGERHPNVKLWDYQSLKLCHIIELQSPSCAVRLATAFPLLAIACSNEKVSLYKLQRSQNVFKVSLAQLVNLRYPEDSLNCILSLQTFNDIKAGVRREEVRSLCANSILFAQHNKNHCIVLAYGKGNIIAFSLTELNLLHFRESPTMNFTLNIQRPIRQSLQRQLSKNQFGRTPAADQEQEGGKRQQLQVLWNKLLHKDTITDLDCFQQYFSTLSLDGYFKMGTLDTCEVVCSLCTRYPLPNLWKIQIFKHEEISRKLYQAIKVIADLLNDRDSLNQDCADFKTVQGLMRELCQQRIGNLCKPKQRTIRLLKDQLSVEDLRHSSCSQSQQSLKYLQAYRRVNLMKQVRVGQSEGVTARKGGSSMQQKKNLLKLLSPNYFPNLYARQDNSAIRQHYQALFARSANASLNNSRIGRMREATSKQRFFFQSSQQKSEKRAQKSRKLIARSLSQGTKLQAQPQPQAIGVHEAARKQMIQQLNRNQPLKSVSLFMKKLSRKLPNETLVRKQGKKFSNFNSRC